MAIFWNSSKIRKLPQSIASGGGRKCWKKKNLFDCYRCCCHCLPVGNVSQRFDFPPVKRSHVIGSLFRPPEASGVTPIGLILPSLGEICPLYQHRWETSRNVFENGPSVALAVSNESILNQQFYLAIFLYKKIFELCGTFLAAAGEQRGFNPWAAPRIPIVFCSINWPFHSKRVQLSDLFPFDFLVFFFL